MRLYELQTIWNDGKKMGEQLITSKLSHMYHEKRASNPQTCSCRILIVANKYTNYTVMQVSGGETSFHVPNEFLCRFGLYQYEGSKVCRIDIVENDVPF